MPLSALPQMLCTNRLTSALNAFWCLSYYNTISRYYTHNLQAPPSTHLHLHTLIILHTITRQLKTYTSLPSLTSTRLPKPLVPFNMYSTTLLLPRLLTRNNVYVILPLSPFDAHYTEKFQVASYSQPSLPVTPF